MEPIEYYKEKILEADQFIRQLDEHVREEAFRLLMGNMKETSRLPTIIGKAAVSSVGESQTEDEEKSFQRISSESLIPVERLHEIFVIKNSVIEVADSSIANNGPTDLLKKIALLCVYGNIIGKGIAKINISVIYKNLKELNASTSAYSRDVKTAEGIKVLSDGSVMLTPEGRVNAKELLMTILRLNGS